ncbi:hypothetical protein ACFPIJ_40450 [Dactylosporangium cerinum]|uniref:Uncharacterized protein n=1 Tax=Dactylosporangium cerinum TaxID=1434730 RepID=A0ABV9W8L3_9ACTN
MTSPPDTDATSRIKALIRQLDDHDPVALHQGTCVDEGCCGFRFEARPDTEGTNR